MRGKTIRLPLKRKARAMENAFGKRVEQLLVLKGITQKQLSKESGISQSSICQYIAGNRTPTLPSAIAVANVLQVPIELLLDENCASTGVAENIEQAVELIVASPGSLTREQRDSLLRALLGL